MFPPLRPRLVQLLENSAAYSEIANPKQASPPKADQQVEVQLQVGAPDGVGAQGAGEAARAEPPLVRSE